MKWCAVCFILLIFSTTYSQNPEELWERFYPSTPDTGNFHTNDAAIDLNGNIYLTGYNTSLTDGTTEYVTIKFDSSGNRLWTSNYRGDVISKYTQSLAVAVDSSGNVYVTGTEKGAFITTVKYNPKGKQLWSNSYLSDSVIYSSGRDIIVDNSGNVYVTGTGIRSVINYECITIKYNSSGTREWIAFYDDINYQERANAIAIDSIGNIYVTGNHFGGLYAGYSFITIKYNSSGAQLWADKANIPDGFNISQAIKLDASGNVYVVGSKGYPGTNMNDFVTIKYNSSGVKKWTRTYNGADNLNDQARDLVIDNLGFIYVTGYSTSAGGKKNFLTIKYDSSGTQQWVQQYNGTENQNDEAFSIAVDKENNIYAAGNTLDSPNSDIAVIKYNSSGVEQWVKKYNGSMNSLDEASKVLVFNSGKIYLAGTSNQNLADKGLVLIKYINDGSIEWKVEPGLYGDYKVNDFKLDISGNIYLTGYGSQKSDPKDFLTMKCDSLGNIKWTATYNGPDNSTDEANDIDVDEEGNVYVTGQSKGIGTGYDYATIKYDASGNQKWIARYNSPAFLSDEAQKIKLDKDGNVYVSGNSLNANGNYDIATIKYNNIGQFQWVKRYNGMSNGLDVVCGLDTDKECNIYVGGTSDSVGTLYNYIVLKYNLSGDELWIKKYNGLGNDGDWANAMTMDDSANIYVTGWSVGSGTNTDYATVKYNSDGVFQWAARWDDPANSFEEANDITVDTDGNVYVTGFSVGAGTDNDYTTVKYNSNGIQQWVSNYNGPANLSDVGMFITLDAYNNPYIIGQSFNGNSEMASMKYDSNGLQNWAFRYNYDNYTSIIPAGILLDKSGNIFIAQTIYASDRSVWNIRKYSQPGFIPVGVNEEIITPSEFVLYQNYPNPFNPLTTIRYEIPQTGFVTIRVYDILGREVAALVNEEKPAGSYEVIFNASQLSSGVYFYRIKTEEFVQTKKLILMK